MYLSAETLTSLNELYTFSFFDVNVNIVPMETAHELHIGFAKEGKEMSYVGKSIKATKKEMTLPYIINKINADSIFVNFSKHFNSLIAGKGLNAYATTYGIGVFVAIGRRSFIDQIKSEVENLLISLGIQYSTEYSEAGWVFRYKISKAKENIELIEKILKSDS